MNRLSGRPRIRFSMLFLVVLVTGACSWFAGYRYGHRSASDRRQDFVEQSARYIDSLSAEKPFGRVWVYNVAKIATRRGTVEGTEASANVNRLAHQVSGALDEQLDSKQRQQTSVQPYAGNLSLVVTADAEGHGVIERFLRMKRMEVSAGTPTDE